MNIPALILVLLFTVVSGQTTLPTTQPLSLTVEFLPHVDATRQIQFAIDSLPAGSTLNLTAHTYSLRGPICLINRRGITLNGNGATLKAMPRMPLGPSLLGDLIAVNSSSDVTISDLKFDGNVATRGFANPPQSIALFYAKNVLITGCTFTNATCDDVFMWGGSNPRDPSWACENVQITKCSFTGANRNAISVVGARFVRIDHNLFSSINAHDPMAGIDIEPNRGDPQGITHDVMIDCNKFTDCFQAITAKYVCRPFKITIIGNDITGGTYGINNEAADVRMEWNTLTGLKNFALGSDNGGSAVIQNNTMINCPAKIYVETGNTVGANLTK